MIEDLDPADPDTAAQLITLQRAAYAVEAALIDSAIPAQREEAADLARCGETFLGLREDGTLVAAVSYKRAGETVDIHRLVTHPHAFRRGLATRLLDELERRERGARRWIVATGAANAPARALYERRGFETVAERTAAGGVRIVELARRPRRRWPLIALACLAVAAVSLLWTAQPTYDPWAWLIWGREIVHGDLVTSQGPSWKPLTVLFTTVFALFGDDAAPGLWLVVARAAGLLAIVMTFRLAARLAGRAAGAVAAAGLAISSEFLRNAALGNSEGLLVALVLWAIERHLDQRRGQAFALGFAAALLRPELWPLWGLYGLWVAWQQPSLRRGVVAAFAAIPVLWLVPEWIGSGNLLRAADRARQPLPESAAFADHPFFEVFARSSHILCIPILAGALVALGVAVARRQRVLLAFAAAAAALLVLVAAMTQAGFSGNLRYVALPAALVCVLSGAGWAMLARRSLVLAGVLALASVPALAHPLDRLREDEHLVQLETAVYDQLPGAIQIAGGRAEIDRCRGVFSGKFEVPAIAWELHRHIDGVSLFAKPPGTTFAGRLLPLARDPRFPPLGGTPRLVIGRSC